MVADAAGAVDDADGVADANVQVVADAAGNNKVRVVADAAGNNHAGNNNVRVVADAAGAVDDADGNDVGVVGENAAGPAQAGLLKSIRNKKISNEGGHSKSIRLNYRPFNTTTPLPTHTHTHIPSMCHFAKKTHPILSRFDTYQYGFDFHKFL